ncbi:MAG TPA: hypothetical protein VEQ59_08975, partial [Polyangiaceae bacterium]|nr:hypothetical protein [Polyangiaceae bacterium]
FELGTLADGSPWKEISSGEFSLVVDKTATDAETALPHKGDYFAWLGGESNESSFLDSEALDVPADAGWLTLSSFRKFQIDSDVTDTTNDDFAWIALLDSEGDISDFFGYWDNTDPSETNGWVKYEQTIDATSIQGQSLVLELAAVDDMYSTSADITGSNYMFDDVSLKAYRCYSK